jgi:dethiobiotin synthetase
VGKTMKKTDFPERLIVTGTDTDIGKTVVSAVLTAGLSAVYWKPVQSGIEGQADREWVRDKTGLGNSHFPPEAYRLRAPVSPHLAAAMEGIAIDLSRIIPPALPPGVSHMIIEGAGGVLAPLNDRHFMIDLFKQLDAPVLVVTPSRVGMINHTLLTVEQLRQHGIPVFGVIMNGLRNDENRKAVEHYGRVPVIGEIEPLPEITPEVLMRTFNNCFG